MFPVGLAARDTLRFEVGYCLYGNDLSDETTPLEAGLGWTVKLKKEDFVGREVLLKQKEGGPARRLAGLQPDDVKAIPRSGYAVLADGETVGHVTSGTFAPTLERGLAMGYLAARSAAPGTRVSIAIRNKEVPAEVVRTPFYRQGSRKT